MSEETCPKPTNQNHARNIKYWHFLKLSSYGALGTTSPEQGRPHQSGMPWAPQAPHTIPLHNKLGRLSTKVQTFYQGRFGWRLGCQGLHPRPHPGKPPKTPQIHHSFIHLSIQGLGSSKYIIRKLRNPSNFKNKTNDNSYNHLSNFIEFQHGFQAKSFLTIILSSINFIPFPNYSREDLESRTHSSI